MIIGAHISKKKTLLATIQEIIKNNGNALQFFSTNPRSGDSVNIDKYINEIEEIKKIQNFKLVIHSAYIINIASPLKIDKRQIDINDIYWFKSIISDLHLADMMNICGAIIHVGKYTKLSKEDGLQNMKDAMCNIISYIKENKLKSKIILETAAGQGTELLVDIDDLIKFYNDINQPKHFKLCFDTCHVWSAGYNLLETFEKIQKETNNAIEVIHLNGSLTPKNSRKDRHSTIREGTIPREHMEEFVICIKRKYKDIIMILETPSDDLSEEIQYINGL